MPSECAECVAAVMKHPDRYLASLTNEGRYRLLIEAVTDYAIYMLDPSGVVTSWNPGAQRFKGYTADEIIGQHFSRFYTEEDQKAGLPARALEIATPRRKIRGGRLARPQGRHALLGLCRHRSHPRRPSGEDHRLCQNHARHDRAQGSAGETRKDRVRSRSSRKRWRRSASSLAASPTILTTC